MRNEKEYSLKYAGMRILKSIQEYLKVEDPGEAALYPIKVPSELLYHVTKLRSPEESDRVVHAIFRLGLKVWADKFFEEVFGSPKELEGFIEVMKREGLKREGSKKAAPAAVPIFRVSRPSGTVRKEKDLL
jgi:hypothetical protein